MIYIVKQVWLIKNYKKQTFIGDVGQKVHLIGELKIKLLIHPCQMNMELTNLKYNYGIKMLLDQMN